MRARAGEDRAFARIEKGIVLERANGRLGGIESGAAASQDFVTGVERALETIAMGAFDFRRHFIARHRSGAAVNY
jgi:hypothetical protein